MSKKAARKRVIYIGNGPVAVIKNPDGISLRYRGFVVREPRWVVSRTWLRALQRANPNIEFVLRGR